MLVSLNQNNVVERRNRTLLDMVWCGVAWSMFSNSNLPILLWNEAIKTVAYILKCVPSKLAQRHLLNNIKVENRDYDICMFGDVGMRRGFIIHKRVN